MEFFKIWKTSGGVIGVNRLSLGDLIGANILVLIVYLFIMVLLVQILPLILMLFYFVLVFQDSDMDARQRPIINLVTIITVIYFMIDFHYGFISYTIFCDMVSKESFDSFAIFNFSLGLTSVFLLFFGHGIIRNCRTVSSRLLVYAMILFLGVTTAKPISRFFVQSVITQNTTTRIDPNIEVKKYVDKDELEWQRKRKEKGSEIKIERR